MASTFLTKKLGGCLPVELPEHDELANDHVTSLVVLTNGTNIRPEVLTSVDDSVPTKPHLEDFWNVESIGVTMESTSRQRSGKGAIRKRIPTPKTELTIRYLYHENIS